MGAIINTTAIISYLVKEKQWFLLTMRKSNYYIQQYPLKENWGKDIDKNLLTYFEQMNTFHNCISR